MSEPRWPDDLQPPHPARLQSLLATFWADVATLALLLPRQQLLLAIEQLHTLRQVILEMMLALNGIRRPATRDLNTYLSVSQRSALEKTLLLPSVERDAWQDACIGQAVALVVIYRWYAPQLVAKYGLLYPHEAEDAAHKALVASLPTWPQVITTE